MNINLSLLPGNGRIRICSDINKQLKLAVLEHKDKYQNCHTLKEEINLHHENQQLIDFMNHYEEELGKQNKRPYPKCK